jgi:hypothetical protein
MNQHAGANWIEYTKFNFHNDFRQQRDQQDIAVAQFVSKVFYTMNPDANTPPYDWINGIVMSYKDIRKQRAKGKKKEKDGMKGLRMPIIVGVLLYCMFIIDNMAIPAPMLIMVLNKALQKYQTKIDKKEITLVKFDEYRFNDKKGIKNELIKIAPRCYGEVLSARVFVQAPAFRFFSFNREQRNKASKLADIIQDERLTKESTSIAVIAMASIYTVGISERIAMDSSLFNIPIQKLAAIYNSLVEMQNSKINKLFPTLRSHASVPKK